MRKENIFESLLILFTLGIVIYNGITQGIITAKTWIPILFLTLILCYIFYLSISLPIRFAEKSEKVIIQKYKLFCFFENIKNDLPKFQEYCFELGNKDIIKNLELILFRDLGDDEECLNAFRIHDINYFMTFVDKNKIEKNRTRNIIKSWVNAYNSNPMHLWIISEYHNGELTNIKNKNFNSLVNIISIIIGLISLIGVGVFGTVHIFIWIYVSIGIITCLIIALVSYKKTTNQIEEQFKKILEKIIVDFKKFKEKEKN